MKANVSGIRETRKNIDSYRKESGFSREIAVINPADGATYVSARFYWPGQTAYCCLWVHGDSVYGRGYGKAGGYGYHKESAALAEAIADAGIDLDENIGGRGQSLMRDACLAIGRAVSGKRKLILHVAHP